MGVDYNCVNMQMGIYYTFYDTFSEDMLFNKVLIDDSALRLAFKGFISGILSSYNSLPE